MASAETVKMTMLNKRFSNPKLADLMAGLAITLLTLAMPGFSKPRPLGQLPPPGSLPAGQLPSGSGYLPAGYLPGSIGTTPAKPKHTHKPKATHHHTTHAATHTTIILPRSVVHTHTTVTRTITRTEIIHSSSAPAHAATNTVVAPPVVAANPALVPAPAAPSLAPVYSSGLTPLSFSWVTRKKSLSIPQVTGLASGNTPHSIAAWIRVPNLPTTGREWILLLGNGGGHTWSQHWMLQSDGRLQIGAWGGKGVKGSMKPNVWTHLATTFDGNTMSLYINGELVDSGHAQFDLQGIPFSLARRHASGAHDHDFKGDLCGVSIFNRALSPAEVATVSQDTLPPTTPTQAAPVQATASP